MEILQNLKPVKFNHPNGSTGRILSTVHYDEDTYYVEWCYGLDVQGNAIISNGVVKKGEFVEITEEDYYKVRYGPAFGGEFR